VRISRALLIAIIVVAITGIDAIVLMIILS
jgi:hypothetical protein